VLIFFEPPFRSAPQQVKETCGGYLATTNEYSGIQGTAAVVGDATVDGVKQIQLELMRNGPGTAAFKTCDGMTTICMRCHIRCMTCLSTADFHHYSGGVYVPTAPNNGRDCSMGHAMVFVGWGEENGVPYWLLQNSWGVGWGEQGFVKFRRGSDDCGIESYGMTVVQVCHACDVCYNVTPICDVCHVYNGLCSVVQPESPSVCPNKVCRNRGKHECKIHWYRRRSRRRKIGRHSPKIIANGMRPGESRP